MEVVPEAVIILGAGVTGFLVGALKSAWSRVNERTAALAAAGVGVAVGLLVYGSGIVDTEGMSAVQVAARAILGGVSMGAAASGGRSWSTELRGTGSGE